MKKAAVYFIGYGVLSRRLGNHPQQIVSRVAIGIYGSRLDKFVFVNANNVKNIFGSPCCSGIAEKSVYPG
jgi:hypothetical protein